uniref:Ig-like domain-containing protein n=1 Tax=Oreochromis niloticus TaxID=8128 RepID=A0A669AWC8_ORENI
KFLTSQTVSPTALTAVIQTQQTVLAAVGEDAEFSCQLLETKDVLQVTWQKISPEVETNVATYSKQFGQRVNDGFTDKVEFKHTGLQNCSIVIRNVTEQDEGCYPCLFNTYPEGSFTGQTCLKVYELHEPVVDVRESNTTEEWVVSCSATGRPAPTVTLSVSQQDLNFSQYNTVSVSNTNTTFTVTTTAVLSGSCKHSTQVGCAARVLSAPHREVMVMIPDDDDDGLNEKSGSNQRNLGMKHLQSTKVKISLKSGDLLKPTKPRSKPFTFTSTKTYFLTALTCFLEQGLQLDVWLFWTTHMLKWTASMF